MSKSVEHETDIKGTDSWADYCHQKIKNSVRKQTDQAFRQDKDQCSILYCSFIEICSFTEIIYSYWVAQRTRTKVCGGDRAWANSNTAAATVAAARTARSKDVGTHVPLAGSLCLPVAARVLVERAADQLRVTLPEPERLPRVHTFGRCVLALLPWNALLLLKAFLQHSISQLWLWCIINNLLN